MAEETEVAEQIEEPIDENAEIVEPAVEVVPDAPDPHEAGAKAQWADVLPELPYDDVAPHARMGILLSRLASLKQGRGDEDGSDKDSRDARKPTERPVVEIPNLDVDDVQRRIAKAIEDSDGESLAKAIAESMNYGVKMAQLAGAALSEYEGRIQKMQGELTEEVSMPRQFKAALDVVPGSTQADISLAREKLRAGEAKTAKAALQIAVFERQAGVATPQSSEESRRKASAINASAGSRTTARGSAPAIKPWNTAAELKRELEKLAAEQ